MKLTKDCECTQCKEFRGPHRSAAGGGGNRATWALIQAIAKLQQAHEGAKTIPSEAFEGLLRGLESETWLQGWRQIKPGYYEIELDGHLAYIRLKTLGTGIELDLSPEQGGNYIRPR